jgi:hypothetical protein
MCCDGQVPLLQKEVKFIIPTVLVFYFNSGQNVITCFFFSLIYCSRKLRVKRSIKVPAVSTKIADIPPDEYSWRKYGQKPIKGSPHPRYGLSHD